MSTPTKATGIEIVNVPLAYGKSQFQIRFEILPRIDYGYLKEFYSYFFSKAGGVGNHGQGPEGWYKLSAIQESPYYTYLTVKVWPNGNVVIDEPYDDLGGESPSKFLLTPELTTQFRDYIYNLPSHYNENTNIATNELIPAKFIDRSFFCNYTNEELEAYVDAGNDVNAIDGAGGNLIYTALCLVIKNKMSMALYNIDNREFIYRFIKKLLAKNVSLQGHLIYRQSVIEYARWMKSREKYLRKSPNYGKTIPYDPEDFDIEIGNFIVNSFEEQQRMKGVANTVHTQRVLNVLPRNRGLPTELQQMIGSYVGTEPIRPGNIGVLNYLESRRPAEAGAGAGAGNARRQRSYTRVRKHRGGGGSGAKKRSTRMRRTRNEKN